MTPSSRLSGTLLALLLVATLAVGSVGGAVGAPVAGVTKAQVKKLVKKGITKAAPGLSVANAAHATDAGAVDGVDSANLVQTAGRLQVVAAAAVDSDGTILTSVGQFTLAKTGTGTYVVILSDASVTLDHYILTATAGIGQQIKALVQLGTARFYTFDQAGNPVNGAFQLVIYRTG